MIVPEVAKEAIKAKLLVAKDNVTDPEEALDALVDAIYEVIVQLVAQATVSGGKIT